MKFIAAFDIGTTSVKGILVSREARVYGEKSLSLATDYGTADGRQTIEQNPEQWYAAVVRIARDWWSSGVDPDDVELLVMSGQMQDCIPVDHRGMPVRPAMLYSDHRAAAQAKELLDELGEAEIRRITGNHMDGSLVLPKLLWLKQREPETLERTACFLISAKDYVIRRLTGRFATDPTSAATAGMMELSSRQWRAEWLGRFGLNRQQLPEILPTDAIAGHIMPEAAAATGFRQGTPVLCGVGDAGATTIGAGARVIGDMYAYLGTTGWVAGTTDRIGFSGGGVFHLAHPEPGMLIAIAPLTNAGNAHSWALGIFGSSAEISRDEAYDRLESEMKGCDRAGSSVVFLPYLNGERCPVQDPLSSGSFIGLTSTTTKAEMACAVLEGVAMAMRQVMGLLTGGRSLRKLVLIGGGSQSRMWNQIFADITGAEVIVPQEAQYLPALGCAAAGFVRLGWSADYGEFGRNWLEGQPAEHYIPDPRLREVYRRKYSIYLRLYPALKDLFASG
jgi:xylulokinase